MSKSVPNWREIGRAAYHAGHPAIPAFDPRVMAAIRPLPIGGAAVPLMRAWLDGWLTAHLAECPMPTTVDRGELRRILAG